MKLHFFPAVTVTMLLFVATAAAFAHGDEKHKGKITKVTPVTTTHAMADSAADEHEHAANPAIALHDHGKEVAIQKDIEQIIADTQSSTSNTVIKVASLALALLGVVVAYYPRKNSTSTGNKTREPDHED
ncbi:MAG: hypothetical protein ACE5HO_01065 [bacterium]